MSTGDLTPNGDFVRVLSGDYSPPDGTIDAALWQAELERGGLTLELLTEQTRNQFGHGLLVLMVRDGTERVLRDRFLEAVRKDLMVIRSDGLTSVTLAVIVLRGKAVRIEDRTVRVGNCTSCWRVGGLGLHCEKCRGQVYRPCFFGPDRHLGDPTHRAEMMNHQVWHMTRDTRQYNYCDLTVAPVSVSPVNFVNRLYAAGSEVLDFDEDCLASNLSSALGVSPSVIHAIRRGDYTGATEETA
jgi:hypothetical protein